MLLTAEQGIKLFDEIEDAKTFLPDDLMHIIRGYGRTPVYAYVKGKEVFIDQMSISEDKADITDIISRGDTFVEYSSKLARCEIYEMFGHSTKIIIYPEWYIEGKEYMCLSKDFAIYKDKSFMRIFSTNDLWDGYVYISSSRSVICANRLNMMFTVGSYYNNIDSDDRPEIRIYDLNLLVGKDRSTYINTKDAGAILDFVNYEKISTSIPFPLADWKSYEGIFCDYIVLFNRMDKINKMVIVHPVTKHSRYVDISSHKIDIPRLSKYPDLARFIWVVKDGINHLLNVRHLAWNIFTLLSLDTVYNPTKPPKLLARYEDDVYIAMGKKVYLASDTGLTLVYEHEYEVLSAIF